jgi:2-polyprenyl-3-methyl-5-hydroxy-6-metoxy-1,4-benzoquinol methylase
MRRVAGAYDSPLIRLYVYIRFKIINRRMVALLLHYIPEAGTLVNLGCGFGLFDLVFGLAYPDKPIIGCDLSPTRLDQARAAQDRLGLRNNHFELQDLSAKDVTIPPCKQILVLDILHHLPYDAQDRLIAKARAALEPGGWLIVKDIDRDNKPKLAFTWLLDYLMTRGEKTYYSSPARLIERLERAGFAVTWMPLNDWLPYPHLLVLGRVPGAAPVGPKIAEKGVDR